MTLLIETSQTRERSLLSEWIRLVTRFRAVLVLSAIAGALAAYGATARFPPAYDAEARIVVAPHPGGESRVQEVMSSLVTPAVAHGAILAAGRTDIAPATLVNRHLAVRNPRGYLVTITVRLPHPQAAADVANGLAAEVKRLYDDQAITEALTRFDAQLRLWNGADARSGQTAESLAAFFRLGIPLPRVPVGAPSRELARLHSVVQAIAAERRRMIAPHARPGVEGGRLATLFRERDELIAALRKYGDLLPDDAATLQRYQELERLVDQYEVALREQARLMASLQRLATAEPRSAVHISALAAAPLRPSSPQPLLAAFGGLAFAVVSMLLVLALWPTGDSDAASRVR